MPNYKVSGYVNEACDIRLMEGNSFVGYKASVPAGIYELIFTLDSIENVDVIAVRPDGKIVGYGGITPVSTSDSANITVPSSQLTIQSGSFTGNGSLLTKDVSITSVDTSKSIVIVQPPTTYGANSWLCEFSSSTNLRFTRLRNEFNNIIKWSVWSFNYGVASIHRGLSTSSGGTLTIATVNPLKSVAFLGGFKHNTYLEGNYPIYSVTAATTLTITSNIGGTHHWQVVEFE